MWEWINRVVIAGFLDVMEKARTLYGVNPIVFLVLYLGSAPVFYYSLFRMARAVARRKQHELPLWSTVFLAAVAAPFLYVLFFGHNLPWWVYVIIALLIGQGVFSLVRRLTKKKPPGEGEASAANAGSDATGAGGAGVG